MANVRLGLRLPRLPFCPLRYKLVTTIKKITHTFAVNKYLNLFRFLASSLCLTQNWLPFCSSLLSNEKNIKLCQKRSPFKCNAMCSCYRKWVCANLTVGKTTKNNHHIDSYNCKVESTSESSKSTKVKRNSSQELESRSVEG